MKATYRAALIVGAFVFLLPLSARSEIRAGSFDVGPFVGYNFFEDRQNLENRPIFGLRLGYNFTKHFGIEGAGEFIDTHVDDQTELFTEGRFTSPINNVQLYTYHIDAVYSFMPDRRFNPFVLAGFGGAQYRPSIETKDMFAFNVGAGAKYWLTDSIALRLDLKDYMVTEMMQETYHNLGATLGLTFSFGGQAKPTPAPIAQYEAKPEPKSEVQFVPTPAPTPEPRPTPPPPSPIVEEKVVIVVAAEPIVEKKIEQVIVAAAAPKIIVLAFEDVHFDFDKSTLRPEAQMILKRNIQLLKDNPKAKIRVAGYTSASGTEEYNQRLSERRASSVQEYLISEGIISRDRLTTIGYGEKYPEAYESAPKELYSPAAKANMRVLFEIIVQ